MMSINDLRAEVKSELLNNILPFWMNAVDLEEGGFIGQINGMGQGNPEAPRGGVLNARILWTFAAAYRIIKDPILLAYAERAKDYLLKCFLDKENGGIFWLLDNKGNPIETKKQIYAIGFAIYGLSEYYRATGDEDSLDVAIRLFYDIEEHSFDKTQNGYFEAFAADWEHLEDMRLSEKDANESKTMNTHLHILEAYSNLYTVWKSPILKKRIENLCELFLTKFLNESYHLNLFFNDNWESQMKIISYGHDIEASWLIHETALRIGDDDLIKKTELLALKMAQASIEGISTDGGMIYEKNLDTHHTDVDKHWWVQAETVVGYFNAYQLSGDETYLKIAMNCWEFIRDNLVDRLFGEWFWSIRADGSINRDDDKLGVWKCPYHNGRMCLEILRRTQSNNSL